MRRRILYIEDDAEQLALVRQLLESSLPDVAVDVCTTEAGAEVHLNSACYDLIICDFSLPGAATGAVIAERVLARDPGQPFYLMSEYVGGNVQAEAARVGLELHGKFSTVPREEFVRRIRALLALPHCLGAHHDTSDDSSSSVTRRSQSAGNIAETAEARAPSDTSIVAGTARHERRGRQVPRSQIRLLSPHVMAALLAMGRA